MHTQLLKWVFCSGKPGLYIGLYIRFFINKFKFGTAKSMNTYLVAKDPSTKRELWTLKTYSLTLPHKIIC